MGSTRGVHELPAQARLALGRAWTLNLNPINNSDGLELSGKKSEARLDLDRTSYTRILVYICKKKRKKKKV